LELELRDAVVHESASERELIVGGHTLAL
jgi:hypothetical protein